MISVLLVSISLMAIIGMVLQVTKWLGMDEGGQVITLLALALILVSILQ